MIAFLMTTLIIMLALGFVLYLSSKRSKYSDQTSALSLLPATSSTKVRAAGSPSISRSQPRL